MVDEHSIVDARHKTNEWLVTEADVVEEGRPQSTLLTKIATVLLTMTATICLNSTVFIESAQADDLSDLFNNSNVEKSQGDFLQVDKAFTIVPMQQGNKLTVSLEIVPGHYLYRDKLSIKLPEGVNATPFKFSKPPHSIDDPNFGRVAIFDQSQVTATTTLENTTTKAVNQKVTLTWQGCAKSGLCYPPQKQPVTIKLEAAKKAQPVTSVKADNESQKPSSKTTLKVKPLQPTALDKASATSKTSLAKETKTQASGNTVNKTQINQTQTDNNDLVLETKGETSSDLVENDDDDQVDTQQAGLQSLPQDEVENADNKVDEDQVTTVAGTTNIEPGNNSVNNSQGSSVSDSDTLKVTAAIDQDPFGLAKHPLLALVLLFLAGLGLAFTPCVLPMLPIVSNIIARQHKPTAKGGLLLSGSYALGIAVAYGLLGAIIAVFGQSLGIIGWLQNPIILLSFAAIFILLGLYMLDAFIFPVPNMIKQRLQSASQSGDKGLGSILGSFIAGILSALVVSPCVSAPLFGALLAVSTIGNPVLGFAALFMLGFGLSAPLMLLGLGQSNLMPKAGAWMNWVKQGFALLLFAVALLLISRVFISPLMLMLWAVWMMIVAGWAWAWDGRSKLFTKPMALILGVWSIICLVGAASGSEDILQPLGNFNPSYSQPSGLTIAANANSESGDSLHSTASADIRITSLDDLLPLVNSNDKVLVDVTADWCLECRIMNKTLFTNRPIALEDWQVVKLDITETNDESSRVLSELKLFGPPVLMYFVNGDLKVQQVGAVARSDFENILTRF